MKYALTLIILTAANPALAHGDTPVHAASPATLLAGCAVLAMATVIAWRKRRTA